MDAAGRLRSVTAEDAETILDLVLLSDLAEVGEPNTTIDEVRTDLANDQLVAAVVESPDGELLGYSWVERFPGHPSLFGDIIVRPGTDETVMAALFDWVRATTKDLGRDLPINLFANSKNAVKRQIYERAGATVIRRFYRMVATFDEPPVIPDLPAGVRLEPVRRSDEDLHDMWEITDLAFLDHFDPIREPYERWLAHTVNGVCPDLSLWWFATVDGARVAGLYAAEMPEAGYIDVLGTLRDYRGRGLGKLLLLNAFAEFYRRGYRKVALGVDASSLTNAVRLYESVGMEVKYEGLRYELA
ncbi:MAG TPA: GNAT family N-acetyltransferase [Mycobacteriales bacterium]|nr:GNAT family N-acetyltransferase [Mycobacteriales bacterium]